MPSTLKSLSELFNRRIYRIPDYQRGYSWMVEDGEDHQLKDFWDDLIRLGDERAHYTGQITLEAVPKEKWNRWGEEERWLLSDGWKAFYVVDGQQRLTTSIILLKAALDRLKGNKQLGAESRDELLGRYLFRRQGLLTCPIFGYEKDNPSHEFFRSRILGIASNRGTETETKYTSNLQGAYDFFRDRFAELKPKEVQSVFQKLTNRLRFNEYELEDDFDVFVAFETMNNRGKQLSKLELLKNRLIYLSTLLPVEEAQQRQLRLNITDAWKTIYEYLGKDRESPLDDDQFLRAHWILFYVYSREGAGEFHNFLLNEQFTTRSMEAGTVDLESLQAYVTSLQRAVKWWWAIHFPTKAADLPPVVRKSIERLERLGYGAFEPLLLASLLRDPAKEEIAALVEQAERFVFVAARLSATRGDTGNSHFYRMAGEVYREVKTVAEAVESVRWWVGNHFNLERATVEMEDRFTKEGGQGFYSWRELRFFLFEYEQHLKGQAHSNTSKLNWDDLVASKQDHVTVEHIYPQSPIEGEWPEFDKLESDQQHRLRHSLGNLLALSRPKNSELSNHGFKRKKRGHKGRGYANGSFSEGEIAGETKWTPQHIVKRGLDMLGFLEERWSVSLGDRSMKLRLLGLEFIDGKRRKQ
jgi:hypothetical protein